MISPSAVTGCSISPGDSAQRLPCRTFQGGLSLVELVIAIVVLSIALTGIMSVISYANRYSADPAIRQQAIALAQSKMDEILLREFKQPGNPSSCPPNDGNYDNVCDYNGQVETPAAPLNHYTISVSVVDTDNLGPAGGSPPLQMQGANNHVLRVDVTVTHDSGERVTLSAYRTYY